MIVWTVMVFSKSVRPFSVPNRLESTAKGALESARLAHGGLR